MSKQRRKRGVILTSEGLQKLKDARRESEYRDNFGERYTYEKISEITYLDINTIKRVLKCQEGVDKRTLERFFIGFNLELTSEDITKPNLHKRQDLGGAICVSNFYGRTTELIQLEQWLLQDRCRLVTILGIGGVGKTALSIKLINQIGDKFDCVIWRSLKDAPPIEKFITDLLQFLSKKQLTKAELPHCTSDKITRLIGYLRSSRCLVVLDNLESLLCSNAPAGICRQGYEKYSELFRRLGETDHQSCLLLTSREKPSSVAALEGEKLPVKTFKLNGLREQEGQKILKIKGLDSSELELNQLVQQCSGNASALKIVATTIQDVFAGNVAEFLSKEMIVFGDIYKLLDEQFERLSILEQEVVYWLAINRKPISFSQLREKMGLAVSKLNLIEGLESLSRRSIIESQQSYFKLQSIIMEYILCRFAKTEDTMVLQKAETT
ncbi:WD-40 repeat-containing protein (fragment) [Hyella patelloides LEGE 07179]|uniref:WD-40 repeat-containing protein n=1 Tax=Hyella patelloides LEGE 07179 TaxID=945734 RepID=A0A563VNE3_9CYAN